MPVAIGRFMRESKSFYDKKSDMMITVQLWKNGEVRKVGDFGRDLGKSDMGYEELCQLYLAMGFEEL